MEEDNPVTGADDQLESNNDLLVEETNVNNDDDQNGDVKDSENELSASETQDLVEANKDDDGLAEEQQNDENGEVVDNIGDLKVSVDGDDIEAEITEENEKNDDSNVIENNENENEGKQENEEIEGMERGLDKSEEDEGDLLKAQLNEDFDMNKYESSALKRVVTSIKVKDQL
jgi:hypothetical protein